MKIKPSSESLDYAYFPIPDTALNQFNLLKGLLLFKKTASWKPTLEHICNT